MLAGNRSCPRRWPPPALGALLLCGHLALGSPLPLQADPAGDPNAPAATSTAKGAPTADDWRPRPSRGPAPASAAPNIPAPAAPALTQKRDPVVPAPSGNDGWKQKTGKQLPAPPSVHAGPPDAPRAGPVQARYLPEAGSAPPAGPQGDEEKILTRPRPVSPPATGAETEADRTLLLGAARNALRRGDHAQAIARFEEYFRRFGDDPALRREYAGVLVSANRLRQAAAEYERLLAQRPNDPQLHAALADLHVAATRYRKAIAEYRRALELAPGDLETATRLARAYTFDADVPHALDVFDSTLARLQPGDANVPAQFPALLLDLERPADALTFLSPMREQHPDDLELAADVVRAYSRLGDRDKAVAAVEAMAARAPHDLAVRQSLADALYQAGDYELAGLVYEQILRLDPGNALAAAGTARVAAQFFQPARARAILEGIQPAGAAERPYRLTWAELHQLVGEYTEAKEIYGDFLHKDPADYEARVALAALDQYVLEFEKAKAEFAKVPPDVGLGRKARLGLASTLFDQRLFAQAAAVSQALLAENPGDGDAMALLVRSLAKMDQTGNAVALGRAYLENNPRNVRGCASVHFALGKVLLDSGGYAEAAREFEGLLTSPPLRVPAAYYGLARANEKLGAPDKAQLLLATAVALPGGQARSRLILSDLFAGDFDDPRAADMAGAVAQADPQNLAALIRLADARQRLARADQHIDETVRTCQAILAVSPTNVRGHLALARARATAEHYQEAITEYDRLIALDPCFTVPQREKARVLYSDHQFAAAAAAYQRLQAPAADEILRAELTGWAEKDPRAHDTLGLLLRAGLTGNGLREEVARLAAGPADPEVREGLQRALADYDARCTEQQAAHLEAEAKARKDLRNREAIPVYKNLLSIEPGNEEALFDLGQVYGVLRQTHDEMATYADLLRADPVHREALIAGERAGYELDPQVDVLVHQFDQRGRDGLARIDRMRVATEALLPWGDENEFVTVGFARVRYAPPGARALDGNIPFIGAQGKPCELLLLFGELRYEEFPDRLRSRPMFQAGAEYQPCDAVCLRARAFLDNVVENSETLRQDIYRDGVEVAAQYLATRYWDFGGTARYAHYSDDNSLGELYLVNDVLITLPPCELKLVLDADLQSFAHSTIFRSPDTNDLVGVIHPYFSPRDFAYYEARIEWTHWLSRDYFVHSNQCYYSLQYALGADSNLATYNTFRALANFDVRPWLSVGADAQQVLSDVYRATSANAYLIVRLPCCLH